MEKLQFLLLDAGPIIKLFSLGIWDSFIKNCDVTVSQIVADQAKYASQEFEDIRIDLEPYKQNVKIIDVDPVTVRTFYDKFNIRYKADIHPGEKETLAFLCSRTEKWQLCSADGAVFRALAILGKAHQGISLEEILRKIGLPQSSLEWHTARSSAKNILVLARLIRSRIKVFHSFLYHTDNPQISEGEIAARSPAGLFTIKHFPSIKFQ